LLRGAFDTGPPEVVHAQVAESAAAVKARPETTPLRDAAAPVALEIRYDGKPIALEIRQGQAQVREPAADQQVTFVLRKVDATPDRYGVVLLVNGVNTLFKEQTAPSEASKWVLGPEHRETVVGGYQTGEKTAETFRVLSSAESAANAVRYGPGAGTITLVVFREKKGGAGAPPLDDLGEDLAALARGALPPEAPKTLPALKFRLREGAGASMSRGLIVEGATTGAATRSVEFQTEATPVMSATIAYYRP
jgi:hypothetical protein